MPTYLGIDYGERRIGLSHGDELGLAFPLPAANQASLEERMEALGGEIQRRRPVALVVGLPLHMDGRVGAKAEEVKTFAEELRRRFGLPVEWVDERLTSHAAREMLGKKVGTDQVSRRSGILDSAAATLILQDFLERRYPAPEVEEEEEF